MNAVKRSLAVAARGAVLLPISLGEAGAALAGRRDRPGRSLLHALMGILLSLVSLIGLGLQILFLLRGVLYGVVVPGPYTNAWGGPTLAGAWLAHFGVGLLVAAAGLVLLWLMAQLYDRLGSRWLRGERAGAWVLPTALVAVAAGALTFTAWLHQV